MTMVIIIIVKKASMLIARLILVVPCTLQSH